MFKNQWVHPFPNNKGQNLMLKINALSDNRLKWCKVLITERFICGW